jgi:hypothetical protein
VITLGNGQSTIANATIPLIDAGKATLLMYTDGPLGSVAAAYSGLNASTDVSLSLPAPAVLMAPTNDAVGVNATTVFAWSSAPKSIYQVEFEASSGMDTARILYRVTTTANTATIPFVAELVLPKGQRFGWLVSTYGSHSSIDDAVSDRGLVNPSDPLDPSVQLDGPPYSLSVARSIIFTTAP